jgi:pimeloyl-ACP methyl ester carboxylesterase
MARWSMHRGQEKMARTIDATFRRVIHDPSLVTAMRQAGYGLAGTPAAWAGVMASARPGLLAEVTCPIVLINGRFDQLRVDARAFARAARASPSVRIVTIPRASHLFPMTHRDRTALELARVVSALPPEP